MHEQQRDRDVAMRGEVDRMAVMDRWLGEVCTELGLDRSVLDASTIELLALIKSVAHGPSRPGAPMTAFLIGLASGAAASDPRSQAVAVADRIVTVTRLVDRWPAPSATGTP